jgi:chemotaxis protein MotB
MRDSAEMLKEQLRSKEKEIKQSKANQARAEAKVKHILELSKEKIKDLKYEVEKKELQIQQTQGSSGSLLGGAETDKGIAFADKDNEVEGLAEADKDNEVIENLQKKLEAAVKEKENLAKELKNTSPEINKVVETNEVKDPRVIEALKKLKQDNEILKERITQHNSKNSDDKKQKELLVQEVKRLREQPQSSKKVEEKSTQNEIRNQEKIESYQKLIDEKNELIKSFEKIIADSRDEDNSDKLPPDIIKDLKVNLDEIGKEKKQLEKELNDSKEQFKKKLNEQIKVIEEELEDELKKNKPQKKQAAHVCEEGAPLWMATFSDMVTLVMVFFILMYAIASKNVSTFKSAIIGADAKSIGVLEALNAVEIQETLQNLEMTKTDDIMSEVSGVAKQENLDIETSQGKIIVRVPGASLFKPGQADLQLSARSVLDAVVGVVNNYPNYKIHIQGHTDDESISTEKFPTNWELSAGRATAVLRYFYDKGVEPESMTATGYADTFPLATNDTVPGRAKNRRVEFVLEKEK